MLKFMCIFFCVFFATNVQTEESSDDIVGVELKWAGCGITAKAFMKDLAVAFREKTGVIISIKGGGATQGIRQVKTGESHLGGSCRSPFLISEESRVRRNMVMIAWDALVAMVHKNAPIDNIGYDEVKNIYDGTITYWHELSGWKGAKNKKIRLYTRRLKISGVGFTLRNIIFSDPYKEFSTTAQYFPSSGPLEKAITSDPLSFGFSGISSAQKRDLKTLSLDGIAPSYDNVKAGKYYLYRPLFLTFAQTHKHSKLEKKAIKAFLKFSQSEEAKQLIRNNNVVPFTDAFDLMNKRDNIFY